eukprot:g21890.t1
MHRDESLARSNKIDSICDRFEKQLLAGESRRIEEMLAENTGVDRSRLLRELLLIELEVRQQQGEPASADDYVDRFPNDTDVVGAAVETVLLRHDPAANEETVDVSMNAGEETYVPGDANTAETIVPGSKTEPGQETNGEPGGKQFGDYELLHEIARGGMGVVYKARQTKLNRIVALKMIKSGELAGDEEVKRFHAEAEAAAALDHPGIVPIYEVGQHNDQHFFSMGFVDGAGLDAQLKEGPLPPKDAAGLIKTIAEAVQYAHDKGIVHRDLKPANVLLADAAHPVDAQSGAAQQIGANQTEPGRAAPGHNDSPTTAVENPTSATRAGTARLFAPRITDFGLAKNIAGDSGMTATGQVLGTPSYMPPEQAAGKIEQVGPLADVYSLGAMLYATLTGRPPFQSANVMETLKQVLEREPVSPAQLNPAVDKDLETIVLKCLEKEAAKRYPSARDFASDLDCYLTDKPISARPISRPARLWRWCKRNPLGATVAGLLLFLAIAGPAVAIHQIETNRQLDNALAGEKIATATAQQKEQETATALAKVKVALASEQAALKRKDRALVETEKSIDAYVEVVKNAELLKETRFKPLLKELLKDALVHYTRFVEEHKGEQDEATLKRMEIALAEIGVINQQMGDQQQAVVAFQRVIAILKRLTRANPTTEEYPEELARIHMILGVCHNAIGQTTKAIASTQQALKLLEELASKNPTETRYQDMLASNHRNVAEYYGTIGKNSDALAACQLSLKIQEAVALQHPTVVKYQNNLAASHNNLYGLYQRIGKIPEALAAIKQAIMIREKLVRGNPTAPRYQSYLAGSHFNLGTLYGTLGKNTEALAAFRQALTIWEQLARENPTVTEYQDGLALVHAGIGAHFRKIGKMSESLAAFQQSIATRERLARENPKVTEFQSKLSHSHNSLGSVYQVIGKTPEALASHQEALKIQQTLARENPTVVAFQNSLAAAHTNLGNLYYAVGKKAEALAAYREAIRIRKLLVKQNPTVTAYQNKLASSLRNLGTYFSKIGKTAESLGPHQEALKIRETLARENPTVVEYQMDLADSYDSIGRHYRTIGKTPNALAAFRQAININKSLAQQHPTVIKHQNDLAASHNSLGVLYFVIGNTPEALAAFQQSIEIQKSLARENPTVMDIQDKLAQSHNNLGFLYARTGKIPKAVTSIQQAIKIRETLAEKDPTDTRYNTQLSVSYINLGRVHTDAGKTDEALACFNRGVELNPKEGFGYFFRAKTQRLRHQFQAAQRDYEAAIRHAPNNALFLNAMAWMLATCPDQNIRDGQRAIELARKACQLSRWRKGSYVGTLAAAYAEAGDFKQAVHWQKKSHEMYSPEMKMQWGFLLELYISGKPYREPRVVAALGEPMEPGFLVTGQVNLNNDAGNANLSYKVSGPDGVGTVHVIATKARGKWTFRTLDVRIHSTGTHINVLADK